MRIVLLVAAIGVLTACTADDEAEKKREAERQALKDKAAKLKAATEKDPNAPAPKKPPSKEELIAKCGEDDGAACQGACAVGDAESCVKLGALFEEGRGGVPENFESARVFHRKGCELGAGSGCYAMALFYKLGKSIPKSPKTAKSYFEKGCKLSFEPACLELKAAAAGK